VALVEKRAAAESVKRGDVRFSRKDVRDTTGWSDTQLRVHLGRLAELEYLAAYRDGAGGRFVYELVYDGHGEAEPHLSGLIDASTIAKSRGSEAEVAGRSRPQRGPVAGGSPESEPPLEPSRKRTSGGNGAESSYPQPIPLAAAPRA